MVLPRFHLFYRSDDEIKGPDWDATAEGPDTLEDKEHRLWVTYPDERLDRKRGRKAGSRHRVPKLWAVLIIEKVRQTEDFAYEAVLKMIFKRGDRTIKVWVRNDPADQSDSAKVLGYLAPALRQLTPLEKQMSDLAAKRIYDSIVATWPRQDTSTRKTVASGTAEVMPLTLTV